MLILKIFINFYKNIFYLNITFCYEIYKLKKKNLSTE